MKLFFTGFLTMIASIIIFSTVIAVGIAYNIFYPLVMAIKYKDYKLFFSIWWRLIDGTLSAMGKFFYDGVAITFDVMGNVWGEWIEDSVTSKENTMFGFKEITVSAAIGHLESKNLPINRRGRGLSKTLNKVFGEKRHAIGSWEKYVAYKKIDAKNLKGK